jgi:hypothetical protein
MPSAAVNWRAIVIWGAAFSAVFLSRTAFDWLVPTTDFQTRSMVTTYVSVGLLAVIAFWGAWWSRSLGGGILAAVSATLVAAVFSTVGVAVMLALWHDAATLHAIDGSGGLAEAFTFPFMLAIPALVVGAVGSALGTVTRKACC